VLYELFAKFFGSKHCLFTLDLAIDVHLSLLHSQILAYLFTSVAVKNMNDVDEYFFN
jgi:hypothetical protein